MIAPGLNPKGELADYLNNERELDAVRIKREIVQAWKQLPEKMKEQISRRTQNQIAGFRGAIWEIYLWNLLNSVSKKIEYEFSDGLSKTSIDFYINFSKDTQFLIEAASHGPEEGKSFEFINEPERDFDTLRNILIKKVPKTLADRDITTILAFCNSKLNFISSNFEKVSILYGRPGVKISNVNQEAQMTFIDSGFWPVSTDMGSNYSAVLFSWGIYPGFSSLRKMELWINPAKFDSFPISKFPLDVDFYSTHSGQLQKTSRTLDFQWQSANTFN